MKKLFLIPALALTGCAPTLNLQAAVSAEQNATCPTNNEGKAQLYGARALFDRTAYNGLTVEQRSQLDEARAATDERCGLG